MTLQSPTDPLARLLDSEPSFPQALYVIHYPADNKYAICVFCDLHGLACGSSENACLIYAERVRNAPSGEKIRRVTLDEAKEIAKTRSVSLRCLCLVDNPNMPQILHLD